MNSSSNAFPLTKGNTPSVKRKSNHLVIATISRNPFNPSTPIPVLPRSRNNPVALVVQSRKMRRIVVARIISAFDVDHPSTELATVPSTRDMSPTTRQRLSMRKLHPNIQAPCFLRKTGCLRAPRGQFPETVVQPRRLDCPSTYCLLSTPNGFAYRFFPFCY